MVANAKSQIDLSGFNDDVDYPLGNMACLSSEGD